MDDMDDALRRAQYEARRAYRGTFGPEMEEYDNAIFRAGTVAEIEAVVSRHRDPFGLNRMLNEYDRATDRITPPEPWREWKA